MAFPRLLASAPPVGADGMGEVYKARDTRLDRAVAIKILPASLAADLQFRDRLDRDSAPVVGGAGLSILPTTPPNLTAHGAILGTFQYMAPEQLKGKEADARTDILPSVRSR